jgi:hypothetical protein
MRVAILAAVIGLGLPAAAFASETSGNFPGQKPADVITKIAAACAEGGFGVNRLSDVDVTCGGMDCAPGDGFNLKKPGQSPDDLGSGLFHRFVAEATADGAIVREGSSLLFVIGGRRTEAKVYGRGGSIANKRINALFVRLGADTTGN